jgi:iron complex outermembrane receptor protein
MNSHDKVRRAVRYALFANAAAVAAMPAAHAQDAPATPDESAPVAEVVVTGSRIAEPGLTSVSPVTTVST